MAPTRAPAQPASPGGSSWITSCTVGAFLDVCRREALRTGRCLPRGCSGLGPVRPAQDHIPTVLSLQVSNGPGPGDERTTSLLLLGFLQSCPHSCFQRELEALASRPESPAQTRQYPTRRPTRAEAAAWRCPFKKGGGDGSAPKR